MPFFLVLTLGCKLNQLESESIIDAFSRAGFELFREEIAIDNPECLPSFVIVNTCTVTSKADQKARRVIRKALRDYPGSCVLVTGCYAQLNREDLLKLDQRAMPRLFVVKKNDVLDLIDSIDINDDFFTAVKTWERNVCANAPEQRKFFLFNPGKFSQHTRGFLKIQDGCDKHCTYCRIRLARGRSVSLEADEVLSRLRILEKSHGEAVLTGVNISQYLQQAPKGQSFQYRDKAINSEQLTVNDGQNGVGNLTGLLRYLLDGTEKIAIRLSSLEPECIDEDFAKALSNKRIRPHFHLSVQSGSGKIIEKMGRSYNAQIIEKAVSLLRSAKDDPFLACDIITGFPGETEAEFEETYSLCQKIGFAWIHVFPYSKRPGTAAFAFLENVAESEVTRRVRLLSKLARQGRTDYVRRWIGREVDVLIENNEQLAFNNEQSFFQNSVSFEKSSGKIDFKAGFSNKSKEAFPKAEVLEKPKHRENYCQGLSENYLKVLVRCEGDVPPPGTMLRCRLIAGSTDACAAKLPVEDVKAIIL